MSGPEHIVLSMLFAILIPLVCFAAMLLLLRLAAKTPWLTAICLSVLVATVVSMIGIRAFAGSRVKAGSVVLLPGAVCAIILLVQFFSWLLATGAEGTRINTAERNRILKMIEDGKIDTDEGTELLGAMGRSTALQGQDKFSRLDMAMLCGVALVILGFFLPWAYITMPRMPEMFGRISGRVSAYQAGYHVGAIGWAVFIIAVLSAVPVFITPKDLLYKISMLQIFLILVGLVLVISVLVRAGSHLGVGLILCLVGFAVALVSSGAKLKGLAA